MDNSLTGLGVDPSLRHTGLCLRRPGMEPQFLELKTEQSAPVLDSLIKLCRELTGFLEREIYLEGRSLDYICVERQLSTGAQTSSLMYSTQMFLLREIFDFCQKNVRFRNTKLLMPLPGQLISFLRKKGIDTKTAGTIVKAFKDQIGFLKRISQHCVDAYYLTELAEDVLEGKFVYKLPSKELNLLDWGITNGVGE